MHRFSSPQSWFLAVLAGSILSLSATVVTADPVIDVRDITMIAGQKFQMPLDGFDPGDSNLTFTVVSISDTNVTGDITSGNCSLVLNVSGKDASTNDFSGELVFELFKGLTPLTTDRIGELVESGFYDGLTLHRIIDDFVAQGGDPNGDGTGGSGVEFDDEYHTNLTFTGFAQLAMANSGDDSNDSQFFITDQDLTLADGGPEPPNHLNFNHTIFGQLTTGFDVLEQLMHTPVTSDTPNDPVTIDSAVIVTNYSDAVLRLCAPTNFTGSATVTVQAENSSNVTTQETFTVTVIEDALNERPFLEPLPDLVTTQNVAVSVVLTTVDIEDDVLSLLVGDAFNPGFSPPNVDVSFDSDTDTLTFTPDINFSGEVPIIIGVRDQSDHDGDQIVDELDEYDTEVITLTVVEALPSLNLVLTKGKIINYINPPDIDKLKGKGTFTFNGNSPDDMWDYMTEPFLIEIGDAADPVTLQLDPNDPGWKVKNGKHTWKTPKGNPVKVKVLIDTVKGKWKFQVNKFLLTSTQENPIHTLMILGNDWGEEEKEWDTPHLGVVKFK